MGRTDLMGDPYMGLGPIYGLWVIWEKIDAIKRYGWPIYGFGSIWVWERKKKNYLLVSELLILLVSELNTFHSNIVMLLLRSDSHFLINACNLRNIYNIALLIIKSSLVKKMCSSVVCRIFFSSFELSPWGISDTSNF